MRCRAGKRSASRKTKDALSVEESGRDAESAGETPAPQGKNWGTELL